jgi:trk system potassium uptake protein TrkH
MVIRQLARSNPGRTALLGLILTILVGTVILALPISQNVPINLIDVFYTATSATCTCGSLTVPLSSFSAFGQTTIAILMQIGGLGLITLTLIALAFFIELGMSTQFMASYLLETNSIKEIRPILLFIIFFTLICELLGTIFFTPFFLKYYSFKDAIIQSAFHAISSFGNTGLIFSPKVSLMLGDNYLFLLGTFILIFMGSIGFLAWYDVIKNCKNKFQEKRYNLSLHSKVVFHYTLLFWLVGTVLILLLEKNHAFNDLSIIKKICFASFTSLSMKSTGFMLIAISKFAVGTILIFGIIMFIGSAPGSAGSGVKITTVALALATVKSLIKHNREVELKNRTITQDQVYKAFSIIILSILWILCSVLILINIETSSLIEILLESLSAFSTLGISLKGSTNFTSYGKLILCLTMIAGRVGVLSLIVSFMKNPKSKDYSYPAERVLLN